MRYKPTYKISYSDHDIALALGVGATRLAGEFISKTPERSEDLLRKCGYGTVRVESCVVVKVVTKITVSTVDLKTFFIHGNLFRSNGFQAIRIG